MSRRKEGPSLALARVPGPSPFPSESALISSPIISQLCDNGGLETGLEDTDAWVIHGWLMPDPRHARDAPSTPLIPSLDVHIAHSWPPKATPPSFPGQYTDGETKAQSLSQEDGVLALALDKP